MGKRNIRALVELVENLEGLQDEGVYPMVTGDELEFLVEELTSKDMGFYFSKSNEIKANSLYYIEGYSCWLSFNEYANKELVNTITEEVECGSVTLLYKGKAYHSENYKEFPLSPLDVISVERYTYGDREYLFEEGVISEDLLLKNMTEVEEAKRKIKVVKKEEEVEKQAILDERELMLSVSMGIEKLPKRA